MILYNIYNLPIIIAMTVECKTNGNFFQRNKKLYSKREKYICDPIHQKMNHL